MTDPQDLRFTLMSINSSIFSTSSQLEFMMRKPMPNIKTTGFIQKNFRIPQNFDPEKNYFDPEKNCLKMLDQEISRNNPESPYLIRNDFL